MTNDFPTSFLPKCGEAYKLAVLTLGGINSLKTVRNNFYFGIGEFGMRNDCYRTVKSHLFMRVDSDGILRAYTVPVAKNIGEVPITYMSDGGDDEPAYQTICANEIKDLNLSFLEEDYVLGRINYYADVRDDISSKLIKQTFK